MPLFARVLILLLAALLAMSVSDAVRAADPARGKQLFETAIGSSTVSCDGCHNDPLKNNSAKVFGGRNSPSSIAHAVANVDDMKFIASTYTRTDFADIAAFLGNAPAALSFATTDVGSTSAVQTVTVKASTLTPITGLAVTVSGDFVRRGGSCISGTLNKGTSCTLDIAFTPTAGGVRSGLLSIAHDDTPTPVAIPLGGTGTALVTEPVITVAPASLKFAATRVGRSSVSKTVTLGNTGNAALTLGSLGTTGSDFTITGGSCAEGGSVAPGADCTVLVDFEPSATGARTGSLSVVHNAAGSPTAVALAGEGTPAPAPEASLSTEAIDYGPQTVGTLSAAQILRLANTGTAPLTIAAVQLTDGDFSITGGNCRAGLRLRAGAACSVALRFRPQAVGTRNATLTITHDAAGGASPASLSGIGIAATPVIALTPATLSYSAAVGAAPVTRAVRISNTGTAALQLSALRLAGTGAKSFRLAASSTCTSTTLLAPGRSCLARLSFVPNALGPHTARLRVLHDAEGSPSSVTLSGTGTLAATATIATSAAVLSFGEQVLGVSSGVLSATVTNAGATALEFSAIRLSGSGAADFTLGGTCGTGMAVAAGQSCSLRARFNPSVAGVRTARVSIVSNAQNGTAIVVLKGIGITEAEPAGLAGGFVAETTPSARSRVAAVPGASGLTLPPAARTLDFGSTVNFGSTLLGAEPIERHATLVNPGPGTVVLGAPRWLGPRTAAFALEPGSTCVAGLRLAAGRQCELVLSFHPGSSGPHHAHLVIDGLAAAGPLALSGTASAIAAPELAMAPARISIPASVNAHSAQPQVVWLKNHGALPLEVRRIAVAGGPISMAPALAGGCPVEAFALQPEESCSLRLRWEDPAAPAGTTPAAWLEIDSNAGSEPLQIPVYLERAGRAATAERSGLPFVLLLPVAPWGVRGWRRRRTAAAAGLAALALCSTPAVQALEPGLPAPDLDLPTLAAAPVTPASLRGKLTYLDFWASWCGPCRQSFPWMNRMQARYGAQGFQVVAVNLDRKRGDADQFLAQFPATFTVAFDASGDSAKRYGVRGMPTSLLIDPDGKVIATHSGFREEDSATLEASIRAHLPFAPNPPNLPNPPANR